MRSPRLWLLIWGTVGLLALFYISVSASLAPKGKPASVGSSPSLAHTGPLIVGEMSDFTLAFPPRSAPDIPFAQGQKTLTLKDFRGKTILVNFWATWCAPCLKELPSLDRLQSTLDRDDFEVVAIAADPRGPEQALQYLEKLGISHLTLYTDQRLIFANAVGGTNVLPLSILFDQNGQEVGRFTGQAQWDSPEALALIKAVIDGQTIKR